MIEAGVVVAGKYRLTRLIGAGGMGAVWAAVNESLGSDVALKFLLGRALDREHSLRFVAEAKMAAAIKHRFVVNTFDFGSMEDGTPYMVLELLKGHELAHRLQYGPALDVKDAVRLITQCLSGLEAVHAAGIVHRDLKPENVFVISDSDGMFPKLIDFGVAMTAAVENTPVPSGKRLTQAGVAVGTPAYMAPEQLRAQRDLDQRADLYAMGVILYEMLIGSPPFLDDNAADLMVKITTKGVPRLDSLRPELGSELADVIARALAKDREQRFANAGEMRTALNALIPRLPDALTIVQDGTTPALYGNQTALQLQAAKDPFAEPVSEPAPASQRVARPARWAVGAALAAAALVAGWMWLRGDDPQLNRAPAAATVPSTPPAQTAPDQSAVRVPTTPAQPLPSAALAGQPATQGSAATGATGAEPAADNPRTSRSKRTAAKPARAKPAAGPKKLYRNLDF